MGKEERVGEIHRTQDMLECFCSRLHVRERLNKQLYLTNKCIVIFVEDTLFNHITRMLAHLVINARTVEAVGTLSLGLDMESAGPC